MGKGRHEQVVLSVRPLHPLPLPLRLTPSSARHRSSHTSQTLLCASADGYVRTHDPRNALRRENGDSTVQDLQATGIFFVTIGSSSGSLSSSLALTSARRDYDFPLDPLVKASSTSLTCPMPTPLASIRVRLPFSFCPLSPPTHIQLDTTINRRFIQRLLLTFRATRKVQSHGLYTISTCATAIGIIQLSTMLGPGQVSSRCQVPSSQSHPCRFLATTRSLV